MFNNLIKIIVIICFIAEVTYSDDMTSKPIGPGVMHYHDFREDGPWHIHVLEIDLSNQWIKLEAVKATNSLLGREKTSVLCRQHHYDRHQIIGAINGDFFSATGIPVGAQVSKGRLIKRPFTRSILAISNDKKPVIDIIHYNGKLINAQNLEYPIHGINESRNKDNLILYNSYFGRTSQSNFWGTEVITNYLKPVPAVNEVAYVVVIKKDSIQTTGHGNNPIPDNGIVLSGHGLAKTFLDQHVFVGDTLSVLISLPPLEKPIIELIGGTPRLVRDGRTSVEWTQENVGRAFTYDRHPRTAIGFSQDSTTVYLFAVDGRQPGYSVGMSLFELANYMLEWGVYQGVNLDGGGSTTMIVRNEIINRPSDSNGERAVANALMVVSTAPSAAISSLQIIPGDIFMDLSTNVTFSVSGFDQNFNLINVNNEEIHWNCTSSLGTIDTNGLFMAGDQKIAGYVYAKINDVMDSVKVQVTGVASISLTPDTLTVSIGQQQNFYPQAFDAFGNKLVFSASKILWSVSGNVGTISKTGCFTSTRIGTGYVVAKYNNNVCKTPVSVGIESEVLLDKFNSSSTWTLTGIEADLSFCRFDIDTSIFVSKSTSGKLAYRFLSNNTSFLYLNNAIQIPGRPDSMGIYVYGDGKGHWLRGEFENKEGEKFLVNFTQPNEGIDWDNSWKYLIVSIKNAKAHWQNPEAILSYPITWKKIYLVATEKREKRSGIIYLDNLTAHMIVFGK